MTTLKDLFAGLLLVIFFPISSWAEGVKLQPVEVEAPFPMDSMRSLPPEDNPKECL